MSKMLLSEFYELMFLSRDIRRNIVSDFFSGNKIEQYSKDLLHIRNALTSIDQVNHKYKLFTDQSSFIYTDLNYEINELEKDIAFSRDGFGGINQIHKKKHSNFLTEVQQTIQYLKEIKLTHFISDRDGTINNYCARYRSSIQSAYNAIALTEFALKNTQSATILTSAPLKNTGILDVNVSPEDAFIFAGSKGRELIYKGKSQQLDIDKEQKTKLNDLNQKIVALTDNEKYKKFTLIGSGLQFKFGQTTIARQDISGVIPDIESNNLLKKIEQIIDLVDPDHQYFRIEDTGKDIEIMLTIKNEDNQLKDFDKGDGVKFINETLELGFEKDGCLVCGDTHSDIAMVEKLLSLNDRVFTIFVTKNSKLIADLKNQLKGRKLHIVSTPDILIAALANLS